MRETVHSGFTLTNHDRATAHNHENTMSHKQNSRFQQGSGVYTCKCCGKQTRETGACESQVEMCLACMEEAEAENAEQDGE